VSTSRPALPPSLRRLWRGPRTLQIGRDPARALVLDGVGPAEAAFLGLLDGTRERAVALLEAAAVGVPPSEAARLLRLLEGSGLLDDGAGDVTPVRLLPPADRDRLGPDLACWALLRGGTAAAARALARRRAARVAVAGPGRVASAVVDLLGEAGVGRVAARDPATGDTLAVLCSDDGALVPPELRDRLLLAGVAHLVAETYETLGLVGPLVVPGHSPCLRCLDLHRRDRDPRWPVVAAQLTGPAPVPVSSDSLLAATVAAHAALAAVAHLDDPTAPSPLEGTLTELRLPDGGLRRRRFAAHPACGCAWPGGQPPVRQPTG
jgi:bacteriocin biosynthesis cyclodehydratase domain-containing protein